MPEEITGRELDRAVRAELRTLPQELAARVARHLVVVAELLDVDPELAYKHAKAVRDRASRVAVAREAAGLAAYATGRYAEALAELRAFTRMSGSHEHLAEMADCERGLGRPEKALDLAASPAAQQLEPDSRAELLIVASGARRDLGQDEAAVVVLQGPELNSRSRAPWVARLRYAYADALLGAGREDEARAWFARAAEIDDDGVTDAEERLAALEGVDFLTEADELMEPDVALEEPDEQPAPSEPHAPADESDPA